MKFIFSVLVAVTIAFLIDHLWRKRKRSSSAEDQATEVDDLPNTKTETHSVLHSKAKGGTAKKVGNWGTFFTFALLEKG